MHGELEDIINGFLLGDGSVFLDRKYARFKVTAKDAKYLQWVAELLLKNNMNSYTSHDKRNSTNVLYARADKIFQSFRENWYTKRENKTQKTIPKDLELNPAVLLHWYLGDGSLIRHKENRIPRIVLATNAFSKGDVDFLIEKLRGIGLTFYTLQSYSGFTKKQCGYVLSSKTDDGTPFRFFKTICLECPGEIKDCFTGNKGRGAKRHYMWDKWPTEEDWIRILSNVEGIGKVLKGKRNEIKISQGQLAKKLGTRRDYIKQIERGVRYPGVMLFKRLLNILDIDAIYLLKKLE